MIPTRRPQPAAAAAPARRALPTRPAVPAQAAPADVLPGWLAPASVGPSSRPVPRLPEPVAPVVAVPAYEPPPAYAAPGPVALARAAAPSASWRSHEAGTVMAPPAAPSVSDAPKAWGDLSNRIPPRWARPALDVAVVPDGSAWTWMVLDTDGSSLAYGSEDKERVAYRAGRAAAVALCPPACPDGGLAIA